MVCYEGVVKNVLDVTLFLHNNFIFSCDWFQYDILLFYFDLKESNTSTIVKIVSICCVNIFLFCETLQIEKNQK